MDAGEHIPLSARVSWMRALQRITRRDDASAAYDVLAKASEEEKIRIYAAGDPTLEEIVQWAEMEAISASSRQRAWWAEFRRTSPGP